MVPKGFRFSAIAAGIKKNKPRDIGIIVSDLPCSAAGVFTTNRVKGAPVLVSMKHLLSKTHRAVICNSGCANAATGEKGIRDAVRTARLLAERAGFGEKEVLVASTGVIGELLPMDKIENAIPILVSGLGADPADFTIAIMTTDTRPKTASARVKVGGKTVTIWGCAKGSGMIHPNMATMLAFIVTDAAVAKSMIKPMLAGAAAETFNRITVDGDTSTSDSLFLMANGAAGNQPLKGKGADYEKLSAAVKKVCMSLAEQVVADGEGATRIAEISVEKAKTGKEALMVARAIACSPLVKTALHGMDPNWGRIVCAAGYSGAAVDPEKMELYFGRHCAYKKGVPVPGMEEKLASEMEKKKVSLKLVLNRGKAKASYLFCDMSKDYIAINADYRT